MFVIVLPIQGFERNLALHRHRNVEVYVDDDFDAAIGRIHVRDEEVVLVVQGHIVIIIKNIRIFIVVTRNFLNIMEKEKVIVISGNEKVVEGLKVPYVVRQNY